MEAINSTLQIITCCRISLYPEFKSPSVNDAIFNSIVLYIYNKTRKKEQSFNHNVRWQYVVQTENISFKTQTWSIYFFLFLPLVRLLCSINSVPLMHGRVCSFYVPDFWESTLARIYNNAFFRSWHIHAVACALLENLCTQ